MKNNSKVLGVSCFYHDAAAAIVVNGAIIAAAQEERFTRIKHDASFPFNAINYCLEEAKLDIGDLDAIAFYDNPGISFDRILESLVAGLPKSRGQWDSFSVDLIQQKLFVENFIFRELNFRKPVHFTEHHFSHAASAFYSSPFDSAAVLVIDGVGEWSTVSIGRGKDKEIEIFQEILYPDSLGLLYSAFTSLCGFKVNSGEYKLMGLAPYGTPKYKNLIFDELLDLKDDGSFRLNMDYFGYLNSTSLINERLENLFGGPRRKPEERITKREFDIAASIQSVTEDIVIRLSKHVRRETGEKNLCLAGGVALNCVANGKVFQEQIFDRIWVQPASGDAGGALGAAQHIAHTFYDAERPPLEDNLDRQSGSFLGPNYSAREIKAFIQTYGLKARKIGSARAKTVADLLSQQKIVGLFSGRMEFGPRSLGARSIIGDPRNASMQKEMNMKIKFRESFRPFAPAVLRECVSDYFDFDSDSQYMLFVAPVKNEICLPNVHSEESEDLMDILKEPRSSIPAVTHVDYSARIQTVDIKTNPSFYEILSEFKKITGCSVLINTSFNVRGEPIVCTPKDAYRCFMRSNIDALVIEDYLFLKEEQDPIENDDNWRTEYELD